MRARRLWAGLALCMALAGAGCGGGEAAREALRPAPTLAGCWAAPPNYLNADITAIVLELTAVERPSGDETFTGELRFESAGTHSMAVRGTYDLGRGDVVMHGESFEFTGKATVGQIFGSMVHRDDGESINIAWERGEKGCQDS